MAKKKRKYKVKQFGRSVASSLNDEMSKAMDDAVARGFGQQKSITIATIQYGNWTLTGSGSLPELQELINQLKGAV